MNNVLRLELVREHARQSRAGSNAQTTELGGQSANNQRLLEQLEAENAELRRNVVDAMLQIQALRGGAKILTA